MLKSKLGTILYRWLQQQCTYVEDKAEYDKSCRLFGEFLSRKRTKDDLGHECILAAKKLQEHLREREHKLGNHFRMDILHCNEACTSSPAESMNSTIKHGPIATNSNLSLNKSASRMVDGINTRLDRRSADAVREMNSTYYASCAPTNDHIIHQGQGQIDHCFDQRRHCKSAQIGPSKFLVWNFDDWIVDSEFNHADDLSLTIHVPVFLRVRVLDVVMGIGKQFVKCSCRKWKRRGHPCECFFRIVDNGSLSEEQMLDLTMIDVRFWKAYAAHYGENTQIGKDLLEAQAECFQYENDGIEISDTVCFSLLGPEDGSYPLLGPNTSSSDMREMEYVLSNSATTLREFLDFSRRDTVAGESKVDGSPLGEAVSLSALAEAYKTALDISITKSSLATNDETQNFVGDVMKMTRFVADDEGVDKEMMEGFLRHVNAGYEEVMNKLKSKRKLPTPCPPDKEDACTPTLREYGQRGKAGPPKKRIKSLGYM